MKSLYELASEYLEYRDGSLYWKKSRNSRSIVGGKAGECVDKNGYKKIDFFRKKYLTHRIIFLLENGYLPENPIDHIDGDKLNNNINNLREVSTLCNVRNSRISPENKNKITGVYYSTKYKVWYSQIGVNRRNRHLGNYESKEEAILARFAAEQCLGWGSCNNNTKAKEYYRLLFDPHRL